jgi:branched-chain amino acid aminotransferase
MAYEWTIETNQNPLPDAEREAILANPVFGAKFTDHQVVVTWTKEDGWHDAKVIPYGPIMMDPSAAVLHYGQEIFEGNCKRRAPAAQCPPHGPARGSGRDLR